MAVAFSVGFSPLDLGEVVDVAHRHRLPVIVDASAALPPKANLQSFIAAGADLVGFSGGKGIRGPQASGILCGRKDLIASAALQMWDLDFLPELWNPPNCADRPCPAAYGRAEPWHRSRDEGWQGRNRRSARGAGTFRGQRRSGRPRTTCQTAAHIAAALADLSTARVALVERTELWPIIRIEMPNASRRTAIEVARAARGWLTTRLFGHG